MWSGNLNGIHDKRKTAAERVAALQKAQELEKKAATESADLQKKQLDANIVLLKSKYGIQTDLVNANLEITQQALDKLTDEDKNALLEAAANNFYIIFFCSEKCCVSIFTSKSFYCGIIRIAVNPRIAIIS